MLKLLFFKQIQRDFSVLLNEFFSIILNLDQHLVTLLSTYGQWLYLLLFLIIFCETGLVLLPFLPGDSLLFIVGTLCATSAGIDIFVIIPLLILASMIGDHTNYWIGRWFGGKMLLYSKQFSFLHYYHQAYLHAESYYAKWGGMTMVLARFTPIARTFAPFAAGLARMNYHLYSVFEFIGAVLWISSLTLLGYWFGNLPIIKENFGIFVIAIIIASVMPFLIVFIKSLLKKSKKHE